MSTKKMQNLEDLLKHEIQDLYSAEQQLIKALPEMEKNAHNDKLRKAFHEHLEETKGQKERLEEVARILGIKPGGETCEAMQGLIKEGKKYIKMDMNPDVKDASLIAAAQRVEHYEISGYGTACYFASRIGQDEVKKLLEETLNQEKNADSKLNTIAKEYVDEKAMTH